MELAIQTPLPPSSDEAVSPLNRSRINDLRAESQDEIALQDLSRVLDSDIEPENGEPQSDRNVSSLAPVDGGFQAWSFLAGAFVVQTFIWGIPNSFGVFLNSYMQDARFATQPQARTILPLIGTLSSGIMYCSGVVLYPILARYPRSRKGMMWSGAFLSWLGLFLASFVTKVTYLLLFQGIVFGIGGSLLYAPSTSYMMEWFVRRRGLASGIINAGTSVGGLALPPTLPKLIEKIGLSMTLRCLSLVFAITILVQSWLKPRLPESASRTAPQTRESDHQITSERPINSRSKWLTNAPFQLALIATTVQGLAYFLPVLYLPSFASSLGLSPSSASLSVAFLNGSSILSRVALGVLSDKVSPFTLGMLCALGTALATFVLWGVVAVQAASHFSGLLAFGVAYGALTGGWTSLMPGFIRPVAADDPQLATNLMGILYALRGVGNILSTPISSSLFDSSSSISSASPSITSGVASLGSKYQVLEALGSGGGYEKMIIYVGSCFAGAGVLAGMGALAEKTSQSRAGADGRGGRWWSR
ncbi:MFS general substrate transporter [Schizopora paradoxa]|uniref:MFS general substrate transporter n=1 Tax=Schizopora paradoxa TaxID=27342 RepID=A0A0H2RHQ9_9AGAM|nr:MFS general substrate transporter [Schizopora paradoxa]